MKLGLTGTRNMNILIMSFNLTNLFCQGSGKADESFAEKPALKKAQYQFLSSTITTSADDQTKDNESRRLLEKMKTLRTLPSVSLWQLRQPAIYSDTNNLSMWVSDTHVISVTFLP